MISELLFSDENKQENDDAMIEVKDEDDGEAETEAEVELKSLQATAQIKKEQQQKVTGGERKIESVTISHYVEDEEEDEDDNEEEDEEDIIKVPVSKRAKIITSAHTTSTPVSVKSTSQSPSLKSSRETTIKASKATPSRAGAGTGTIEKDMVKIKKENQIKRRQPLRK